MLTYSIQRLRAVLAILLLGLLGVAVAMPTASRAAEKGTNSDLTWGIGESAQNREGQIIGDSHAQWVRMEMSWRDLEPTQGEYDQQVLHEYDRAVDLARAAGSRVLAVVDKSPTWASGSTNRNAPPLDPADYAVLIRDLAARYQGQVSAYEIWNEENSGHFWPSSPNPAKYAALLKAASPAVRAADPSATVVFGGLATNDYTFLESVYAAEPGIGSYFDAMASHPYTTKGVSPETTWNDANGRIDKGAFAGYRELRQTMLAHGDDKPIWLTEFGWATLSVPHPTMGGVSEAVQADYLTRAYWFLEQDTYVKAAFVYTLRNSWWNDVETDSWEDQLGLMHKDFSPKLAYSAFKDYVPGSAPAPTVPPPAPSDPPPAPSDPPPAPSDPPPAPSDPPPPPARDEVPPASETPTATEPVPAADPVVEAPTSRDTDTVIGLVRLVRARRAARAAGRRLGRQPLVLKGRVRNASSGRVRIYLERRVHSRWRRAGRRTVSLSRAGRFSTRLTLRGTGKWRVRAAFTGASGLRRSTSRFRYFRVPRTG